VVFEPEVTDASAIDKRSRTREHKSKTKEKHLATQHIRSSRLTRSSMTKSYKTIYPPGTAVQTLWAPAVVHRVYGDNLDVAVFWHDDPSAVYTIKASTHMWLEADRPGPLYDSKGKKTRKQFDLINHIANESRATRRDVRFRGFLLNDLIGNVTALAVNDSLPKHWHQIQNHILKPVVEDAEVHELQGLCALGTFGKVMICPEGHMRIPLMWVITAKPDELGKGMLATIKARLTVMGNRQNGAVNKAKTYSPVAHPVSYKVILVLHMGDDSVEFLYLTSSKHI